MFTWLFLLFRRLVLPFAREEVAQGGEVSLELDAQALGGEGRLGEIAVVGFAVSLEVDGAGGREEVVDIKVAHKVGGGGFSFVVAHFAVEQEAVVEQAAG